MLKRIKNWLQVNALFIALVISVIIVLLSLIKTNQLPIASVGVSDKALHSFAYLVLTWSWLLVFRKNTSFKTKLVLFAVLLFFGIILELIQGEITHYRTADWKDVVANAIGILLGIFTFKNAYKILFK